MRPRRWFVRSSPLLATDDAANRTAAYVYGNVLVLAAVVPLSAIDLSTGAAVLLVLGTAISTFCAHLFAGLVGASMRVEQGPAWVELRHHLRDAVPVLTSGLVPAGLLVLAWVDVAPQDVVLLIAEGVLILRIGWTGVVAGRLRGEPSSLRLLFTGVGLSVVGAVVVAIKVVLTH